MSEKAIRNAGCIELTQRQNVVLVSNPSGNFWGGKVQEVDHVERIVVIQPFNRVQSAPPGFYDNSGWKSIIITPEMVGKRIAVFFGIEWKDEDGGEVSE